MGSCDSDSEDSDDTLREKRARRAVLRSMHSAAASRSKSVAVPPTPIGVRGLSPLAANSELGSCGTPRFGLLSATEDPVSHQTNTQPGKRQRAASPSVSWRTTSQSAPEVLRAHDSSTTLPAGTAPGEASYRMLLEQNAAILAELSKQAQQLVQLQQLVQHVARELGGIHNHPHLVAGMPELYNPFTEEPTRPGPKDNPPARALDPREIGWLHAQIRQVMTVNEHRCQGFKRIVAPQSWQEQSELDVSIVDLDARTQWKLWHYAFGDPKKTPLQSVLTDEEMEASRPKKAGKEVATPPPILNEESYRHQRHEMFVAESRKSYHEQRLAPHRAGSPCDAEVSSLLHGKAPAAAQR